MTQLTRRGMIKTLASGVVVCSTPLLLPHVTLVAPPRHPKKLGMVAGLGTHLDAMSNSYKQGTVTDGYSKSSGAYVTVTRGARVQLKVAIKIRAVTEKTLTTWKSNFTNTLTKQQQDTLEENWGGGGFLGGFLTGGFGLLFGAADANHYRNSTGNFSETDATTQDGFLKSVHDLTNTDFTITGTIQAVGLSGVPTQAAVYVKMVTIHFDDNTVIRAVDTSDPVVADIQGNTNTVQKGGGKLTVNQ